MDGSLPGLLQVLAAEVSKSELIPFCAANLANGKVSYKSDDRLEEGVFAYP